MSMVPFTRDFSWMERHMGMEDISLIINTRYMLVSGTAITNKDMVNKNAKNPICVISVISIIIGFTAVVRSCTQMAQLSPDFTSMESVLQLTLQLSTIRI